MIELAQGHTVSYSQAQQLHMACGFPDWEPGSAEPWIANLLSSLLIASGQTTVLELGGYKGQTSQLLWSTLQKMGGGHLVVVEHNPDFAQHLRSTLHPSVRISEMDALDAIHSLPNLSIGFVWIDDSHDTPHVHDEIQALIPKCHDGALLCFHDVHGQYQLHHLLSFYNGYSLDLPRVSSSGGLGIIQITPNTRRITPPTVTVTRDGSDIIVLITSPKPEEKVLAR